MLEPVVALGRSRAIAAGVDASEYDAITATLRRASEWTTAFRAAGAAHLADARRAESDGNPITQADAYLAAAACCHIATTLPADDRDGHAEAADAMARALAILQPGAQTLTGAAFRGTLTVPQGDPEAPLVVVVPGLDSSRVEFHANTIALQRRGLATLSIDGPGQGELASTTTVRADYHAVVSEALDTALATGLTPRRIGLMALSLGGYYGALSLAREPRLQAGVTVSGPSTMVWDELPALLQAILTIRAGSRDAAAAFAAHVDVRTFAAEIRQPLLAIDGENDVIPGYSDGADLAHLAPHGEHLVIPAGDHLVGNRRWQWLPRAADYLHRKLTRQ
ncbi:MAG: alpha/beta hydrolase [Actinomycetota bacterium]|nr:MAG: alpha/beta hydrolase [Actinomycetota bacterium]